MVCRCRWSVVHVGITLLPLVADFQPATHSCPPSRGKSTTPDEARSPSRLSHMSADAPILECGGMTPLSSRAERASVRAHRLAAWLPLHLACSARNQSGVMPPHSKFVAGFAAGI